MKQRLFSRTAVGMVVAGAALVVSSSAFATAPTINSIADSWHNLGANNNKGTTPNNSGNANKSSATGEVCVFCHTPHGGDDTAAVPIWNRNLGTETYTRYSQSGPSNLGTTTFDAAEAPVGSVSIACLSCHDGTQALDAMLNAPGSGNNWPTTTTMTGGDVATDGSLADQIVQNLGTDLSNDHPISMQYAGGGVDVNNIATTNDPDFTNSGGRQVSLPSGGSYNVQLMQGTIGGVASRPVWWIERFGRSEIDGERDRSDVILYSRTLENSSTVEPFVECGSCHDPHNVDNPTFLRVSNGFLNDDNTAASGLCLTCHDK
jgi:predicted CXXCH cytochrome family protein